MKKPKTIHVEGLSIINPKAAGIDIGSKSHFVSIGQDKSMVKEFGCFTENLYQIADWLKENDITTVAMESTGSYWKGIFMILQARGFEVILVNGRFTKNVRGRKSDVMDCQWIQKLHSCGLLQGSFIASNFTETLKTYNRHRKGLIENAADYIKKMQKALRLMNIRLDNVLRDVTGKSGQEIINRIIKGERDPEKLANLAHPNVKASKETIIMALTGDWRNEYVFELKQSYEMYLFFHQKINECDQQIENVLEEAIRNQEKEDGEARLEYKPIKKKKTNKNAPKLAVEEKIYQLSNGIDLTQIEGINRDTLLTFVCEVGLDLKAFPTAKAFAAWIGLAPNNKISGGKILSSRTMKKKNILANALKHAANSIGNGKSVLSHFFNRIAYKKGRLSAITATARKLAVIIWNMVTKKQNFSYMEEEKYKEQIRKGQVKKLIRKIKSINLKPEELALIIN